MPRRLALSVAVALMLLAGRVPPAPDGRAAPAQQEGTPKQKLDEPEAEKKKEPPKVVVEPAEVKLDADFPEVVAAHNRIRTEQNKEQEGPDLSPLEVDPKLTLAAREHALDMAVHGQLSHEGTDGSKPFERVARAGYKYQGTGENLAMGYTEVEPMMDAWMNSPKHRENILGPFTQIGVARATVPDGTPYWVVVFGKPWPELDPTRAAAELLAEVNKQRAAAGKPRLSVQPRLQAAAQRHAHDCAEAGRLQPEDSDGKQPLDRVIESGYRFLRLGQTNASGYGTAGEVVASWMEQEGHREQLLGSFNDAGAGYATGKTGQPYWTLILGRSRR
jgi:uncharacterized protein YkwD